MADPTPYDLEQDLIISQHDRLIRPYHVESSGAEESFPVVGQGINSQQYQQMSLAQGDGVLITDDSETPYVLRNMPGGTSETNAKNQMMLRVSENTGRAEAVIAGFYHVLKESMIIDLPAVSSSTTYYICLTYDPEHEEEVEGPIKVKVHVNNLPRSGGRKHIILHTVERSANQLLSDAVKTIFRQYVSPTITVTHEGGLPDPTDVRYGTLGIVRSRNSGGNVIPGTGQIFESRGIHGWHNLLIGDVVNVTPVHTNSSSLIKAQRVIGGMHIIGRMNVGSNTLRTGDTIARLPSTHAVSQGTWRDTVYTTQGVRAVSVSGRDISFLLDDLQGWIDVNTFVPASYL